MGIWDMLHAPLRACHPQRVIGCFAPGKSLILCKKIPLHLKLSKSSRTQWGPAPPDHLTGRTPVGNLLLVLNWFILVFYTVWGCALPLICPLPSIAQKMDALPLGMHHHISEPNLSTPQPLKPVFHAGVWEVPNEKSRSRTLFLHKTRLFPGVNGPSLRCTFHWPWAQWHAPPRAHSPQSAVHNRQLTATSPIVQVCYEAHHPWTTICDRDRLGPVKVYIPAGPTHGCICSRCSNHHKM